MSWVSRSGFFRCTMHKADNGRLCSDLCMGNRSGERESNVEKAA